MATPAGVWGAKGRARPGRIHEEESAMINRAVDVVPLGEDRGDEVAALMARAFQDDPLFVFCCPDPGKRARWLPWVCRWSAWLGYLFGQTLGTAGRLDGVAATVGPAGGEFTDEQIARFGYQGGRGAVGTAVWDRSMAALNAALEPAHAALRRAVPEPHWLLDVLAVEPVRQGLGIGSALLQAVGARADADGVPAALFTFQPKDLAFYRHHGYAVVREELAPASGPPWWGLRRDPGA
jgi:GNAT superfamily N-acetyltransferase